MPDNASTPAPVVPAVPRAQEGLLDELNRKKIYIVKAFALAMGFWFVQFLYQYYAASAGDLQSSLVRSFSLAGTTLIGLALLIGPLVVVFPKRNYIQFRRTFGVAGFTLVALHVLAVLAFLFQWNISYLFFDLNPFKNPVLFGSMAFSIFLMLFSTSTDWAIRKLSYPKWKSVHRLIYFAFIFAILHYSLTNPPALENVFGYLLRLVTVSAIVLELAAFYKKVQSGQAGKGAWVGAAFALLALVLFSLGFLFRPLVTG